MNNVRVYQTILEICRSFEKSLFFPPRFSLDFGPTPVQPYQHRSYLQNVGMRMFRCQDLLHDALLYMHQKLGKYNIFRLEGWSSSEGFVSESIEVPSRNQDFKDFLI